MTQETIEKLHKLEKTKKILEDHLKHFASEHFDKKILCEPLVIVKTGIVYSGSVERDHEAKLYNECLPDGFLENYISNVKSRLERVKKMIEDL